MNLVAFDKIHQFINFLTREITKQTHTLSPNETETDTITHRVYITVRAGEKHLPSHSESHSDQHIHTRTETR